MQSSFFYRVVLCVLFLVGNAKAVDVFKALEKNDKKALKVWFASTDNLNQKNENGQSVLIKAVQKKKVEFVGKLCSTSQIDLNIVDHFGKTVLDYAVEGRCTNLTILLMFKGAKVTSQDNLNRLAKIIKSKKRFFIAFGVFNFIFVAVALVAANPLALVFALSGVVDTQVAMVFSNYEQRMQDYLLVK